MSALPGAFPFVNADDEFFFEDSFPFAKQQKSHAFPSPYIAPHLSSVGNS